MKIRDQISISQNPEDQEYPYSITISDDFGTAKTILLSRDSFEHFLNYLDRMKERFFDRYSFCLVSQREVRSVQEVDTEEILYQLKKISGDIV